MTFETAAPRLPAARACLQFTNAPDRNVQSDKQEGGSLQAPVINVGADRGGGGGGGVYGCGWVKVQLLFSDP